MAIANDLAPNHRLLQALIEFALGEGWVRTRSGHLLFTKQDCAPIYIRSTASNHRADRPAQAREGVAPPKGSGRG